MDSSGYSLEKHQSLTSSVEADELVVAGEAGAQQFTLKDADKSCRTLIENVSEGALTLTPEGLVLYANRRFAQMLRTPPEKVIGSGRHESLARNSRKSSGASCLTTILVSKSSPALNPRYSCPGLA